MCDWRFITCSKLLFCAWKVILTVTTKITRSETLSSVLNMFRINCVSDVIFRNFALDVCSCPAAGVLSVRPKLGKERNGQNKFGNCLKRRLIKMWVHSWTKQTVFGSLLQIFNKPQRFLEAKPQQSLQTNLTIIITEHCLPTQVCLLSVTSLYSWNPFVAILRSVIQLLDTILIRY
jgi:uncharacterized protein YqkB